MKTVRLPLLALLVAAATASASVLYDNISTVNNNPGGGSSFASSPNYRFQISANANADITSIEIPTFIGFDNSTHQTTGQNYSLTVFNAAGSELATYSLSSTSSAYSANAAFLWYRNFTFDVTGLSIAANTYVLLRFNTDDSAPSVLSAPSYYSNPSSISVAVGTGNFTYYFQTLMKVEGAAAAPVPEPSTYGLALGGLALAVVALRRRTKK